MTGPNRPVNSYPDAEYGPSRKMYGYNLRVEVRFPKGAREVSPTAIFLDLLRHIEDSAGHSVSFYDIKGDLVNVNIPLEGDEFRDHFGVEIVGKQQDRCLLGFTMESATPVSTIKKRMMSYLSDNKIFLRVHTTGFRDGIHNQTIGFLFRDHPELMNKDMWLTQFQEMSEKAWRNDTWDPNHKKEFEAAFPTASPMVFPTLPIGLERTSVFAMNSDKKKVTTSLIALVTPVKYRRAIFALIDHLVVTTKVLQDFIPIGLKKENPIDFYNLLCRHIHYIHQHRKIPIEHIPRENFHEAIVTPLLNHKDIHRVYLDSVKATCYVSTTNDALPTVLTWLDRRLMEIGSNLPMSPRRVLSGYSGAPRYGHITSSVTAASADSFDPSFDPSTVQSLNSTRSGWNKAPPARIIFKADVEAFPPLPTKARTNPSSPTNVTVESSVTQQDHFQSLLDAALRKQEQEFSTRLAALEQTMNDRMSTFENHLLKITQNMNKEVEAVNITINTRFDDLKAMLSATASTPPRANKRSDQKAMPPPMKNPYLMPKKFSFSDSIIQSTMMGRGD